MSQHQSWITLDSVIYDYINQAELSNHKYYKLFHLAFRCFEQLGIDFFYQVKSVKLPVNSNKTVTLPADFLNYTKFGVLNGVGEVVPLRYNEKLTTLSDLQPNRQSQVSGNNYPDYYSYSSPFFFNFWDGNAYGNLYGVAGDFTYGGGFKVDKDNGVILLEPSFGYSELVLEYMSSPQEGQDYYVPVQFREAIIAWLAWQDIAMIPSSKRGGLGDKDMRKKNYYNERRLGIARFRPFNLNEAYQLNLQSQRLCVKA